MGNWKERRGAREHIGGRAVFGVDEGFGLRVAVGGDRSSAVDWEVVGGFEGAEGVRWGA